MLVHMIENMMENKPHMMPSKPHMMLSKPHMKPHMIENMISDMKADMIPDMKNQHVGNSDRFKKKKTDRCLDRTCFATKSAINFATINEKVLAHDEKM